MNSNEDRISVFPTNEQIDAAVSGPELDRMVAEHVMGWRENEHGYWEIPGEPAGICGVGFIPSPTDGYHDSPSWAWRPSVDSSDGVACMWEVIEHVYHITCEWISVKKRGEYMYAAGEICGCADVDWWDYVVTCEDTAQVAVCKSALKVMAERRRRLSNFSNLSN